MANFKRIDTHAHFLPAFYSEAMQKGGHAKPDGTPAIPPWNENEHKAFMDEVGISESYLSISSPGVHFGNDIEARDLARKVYEEAASISKRNPNRFGSFVSLPLPDIDGALAEIDYALDVLMQTGLHFSRTIMEYIWVTKPSIPFSKS
jgi:6-methylsalicylate decarboxylase